MVFIRNHDLIRAINYGEFENDRKSKLFIQEVGIPNLTFRNTMPPLIKLISNVTLRQKCIRIIAICHYSWPPFWPLKDSLINLISSLQYDNKINWMLDLFFRVAFHFHWIYRWLGLNCQQLFVYRPPLRMAFLEPLQVSRTILITTITFYNNNTNDNIQTLTMIMCICMNDTLFQ